MTRTDGLSACSDCDDTNPFVNPGAGENCADGVDNNCDGLIDASDPLCSGADPDVDGDGFPVSDDCDDANAAVFPGAAELCDNLDNDCNGLIDEGLVDADSDGFSVCTDCDDTNAAVNPGAAELCDGLDNNCNAQVDEGNPGGGAQCGVTDLGLCQFGTEECQGGVVVCAGNIDPSPELCDALDNDCDGTTDEGNLCPAGQQCLFGICQ